MKGLTFKLNQDKKMQTSLGYDKIQVIDRYIFRQRMEVNPSESCKLCKYYDYMLDVIGTNEKGNRMFFQLMEDELQDEIAYCIYEIEI